MPKAHGRGFTTKKREKTEIIQEIREKLGGREWLTIEDVYGPRGTGYRQKITLKDSDTNTEHTIYFDDDGQPILFRHMMPKQILFVEQFLRMVSEGGAVFTVLDTGVLSNIDDEYVRRFIFREAILHAVVEFPHGAFKAAKADVKSAVVLMERRKRPDLEYKVFASLPVYLGFNNRRQDTPPIYQNDLGKVVCDYSDFLGQGRFCDGNCPWENERFCKFGDQVKMTRAMDKSAPVSESDDEGDLEATE
jgi:hypothetical protein